MLFLELAAGDLRGPYRRPGARGIMLVTPQSTVWAYYAPFLLSGSDYSRSGYNIKMTALLCIQSGIAAYTPVNIVRVEYIHTFIINERHPWKQEPFLFR